MKRNLTTDKPIRHLCGLRRQCAVEGKGLVRDMDAGRGKVRAGLQTSRGKTKFGRTITVAMNSARRFVHTRPTLELGQR